MAVFRTVSLLCLALSLSSAEATGLNDPVTCYVLDAILLIYCIIFTALYFRLKFARKSDSSAPNEPIYEGLNTDEITDKYEELGAHSSQAVRRNRAQGEDRTYEALTSATSDEYQEIPKKKKPRKSKKKASESGAESSRDAGQDIEMERLPSLPARN